MDHIRRLEAAGELSVKGVLAEDDIDAPGPKLEDSDSCRRTACSIC